MRKESAKDVVAHMEHDISDDPKSDYNWTNVSTGANEATKKEHEMSVREALVTYKKAVFWCMAISLAIVMDGYDGSVINNFFAFPAFQKIFGSPYAGGYSISAPWQVGLSMSTPIGRIIGGPIAGYAVDIFGRKKTMLTALVFITGFIFIVFFAKSLPVLCVGEFLIAIIWGIFNTVAPTYTSEVCPVVLRGLLEAYINICWVIGQFIATGVLTGLQGRTDQWAYRIPFALQWMWPILLLALLPFAPESPWWLVRKGRMEDAEKSLKRLSTANVDHKQTVAMLIRTNQLELEEKAQGSYLDCFRGENLRRTEICCAVWSIQSLNGSNMGGAFFFEQAGLNSKQSFDMSVGSQGLNFIACLISIGLISRYGRRSLFMYGLFVQMILMWIIGFLGLSHDATHPNISFAQAGLMTFWNFVWDISNAPTTYTIIGEISATRLRGKTVSLGMGAYALCIVALTVATPYMLNPTALNWRGKTALFYGGLSTLCVIWCWFRLPETKGRTYEELDLMFIRKLGARQFKNYVFEDDADQVYAPEHAPVGKIE